MGRFLSRGAAQAHTPMERSLSFVVRKAPSPLPLCRRTPWGCGLVPVRFLNRLTQILTPMAAEAVTDGEA
jgi:hypothetical protein